VRIMLAIGSFLVGAIAVFAAAIAARRTGYLIVFPEGKQQVELASLFLAGASLIITVIALGLAVAAVVGYTAIKDAAAAAGKAAGEGAAKELLESMVQREVATRMALRQGANRTVEITEALSARGNDADPA
jgi:hypothetical protein